VSNRSEWEVGRWVRGTAVAVVALAGSLAALVGCGNDDGARPATVATPDPVPAPAARALAGPRPSPSQSTVASRRALIAARDRCRRRTPDAIIGRYLAAAKRRAPRSERAFLRNLERHRRELREGPAYAQAAARVFAMSLDRAARQDGFAGCNYELARHARPASAAGGHS